MTATFGASSKTRPDGGGLVEVVEAWIADDPDPRCRAELRALLDADAHGELADRFRGSLRFGTAGLRGPLGAGPSRMNVATVRRASAGLAAYLAAAVPGAAGAGVVVGYDARHGSERFADETARVISGSGLRVLRLPGRLPTPVLAFAVRHLGCAAGVMITASHNPRQDNGYKVFLGDGAQIVPPADNQISAAIDKVWPLAEVPLGDLGEPVGGGIVGDYLEAITAALPATKARDIEVVYTPLHGVGRDVLLAAFERAGFPAPRVVRLQGDPDPDFPTVPKPNPEEAGALDLAIAEARTIGADLVLANDPDADRLAIAIPSAGQPGGWRVLRGDELGVLLGDFLLSRTADRGHALVVTTVVSSSLLGRLAHAAGAQYVETLTGFKWIMHDSAACPDGCFLFGYEEALGYAVNNVVRDKDGISAALLVAGIAAEAKRLGRTIADRLDDVACRFGLHATDQFFLELPGEAGEQRISQLMAALRSSPPSELLGLAVTEVDDAAAGTRRTADGRVVNLDLPPADVLVWRAGECARVVVRPSGTEAKLKVYLEIVHPVGELGDVVAAKNLAASDLRRLKRDLRDLLVSK
ncbi:MAG: phospho-sugar mutase [Solirubrobacteraceae bacterium]|jgi:phosphomannomutase